MDKEKSLLASDVSLYEGLASVMEKTIAEGKPSASIWVFDKDGVQIDGNPYIFVNGCLYDCMMSVRDDVLGRIFRKDVVLSRVNSMVVATKGDGYYFINQKGKVSFKHYNEDMVDIFNSMIGNMCQSRELALKEKERIDSILDTIRQSQINVFPFPIVDGVELFEGIRKMSAKEKGMKSFIESEDNPIRGTLRRISGS